MEGGIALNVQFVAPVVPKTLVGMITKILEVSRILHLRLGPSGRSNTRIILKAQKYSLSSFVIPVTNYGDERNFVLNVIDALDVK